MMGKIEVNNLTKESHFYYDVFEYESEGFKIRSFIFKYTQEVGMHKVTTFVKKGKRVQVHEMYILKSLFDKGGESLLISHIAELAVTSALNKDIGIIKP